jgi:hypothetical protein
MPIDVLPVLAIDDDADALSDVEKAFPGIVRALCLSSSGLGNGESYLERALRVLRGGKPQVLVLDLKWYKDGKTNDAFRFLRQAGAENLLDGVTIVIWSRYLGEAEKDLKRHSDILLRQYKVRTIERVPKPTVPPLSKWVEYA